MFFYLFRREEGASVGRELQKGMTSGGTKIFSQKHRNNLAFCKRLSCRKCENACQP